MQDNDNFVSLTGRVGRDPTVSENGNAARFSLATTRSWMKDGEWQTRTTWHTIVGFGPSAGYIQRNVVKGRLIRVTGSLEYQPYTDDEGIERTATRINGSDFRPFDSRPAGAEELPPCPDDDIPF